MWESNRMTTASDEKKKNISTQPFFFRSKSLGHTVAVDQMKEIGSARIADSSSFSFSLFKISFSANTWEKHGPNKGSV